MKTDTQTINLEDIGYGEFFHGNRKNIEDTTLSPARIIAEYRETYVVRTGTAELPAKITGKMIYTASSPEDYPAVGDWVLISVPDEHQAVIHKISSRKTVLKRKSADSSDIQIIASNIDTAFIIQSPDRDYNLNRFERYIALAESEKVEPVIVLNKIDLLSEDELATKTGEIRKRFGDIGYYTTSVVTGEGISDLKAGIQKGLTYCLLGSSGVGKSSLINTLSGKNRLKTAKISSSTNRGRHITTHRELFILEEGGILIDNPGMREIGVLDSEAGIENVFSDIYNLSENCRFSDCRHVNEPECAVLEAVSSGFLDRDKYDNYMKLVKENEYNTMTMLEKRKKDKKLGKFFKTAKSQIKKYKY